MLGPLHRVRVVAGALVDRLARIGRARASCNPLVGPGLVALTFGIRARCRPWVLAPLVRRCPLLRPGAAARL